MVSLTYQGEVQVKNKPTFKNNSYFVFLTPFPRFARFRELRFCWHAFYKSQGTYMYCKLTNQ